MCYLADEDLVVKLVCILTQTVRYVGDLVPQVVHPILTAHTGGRQDNRSLPEPRHTSMDTPWMKEEYNVEPSDSVNGPWFNE